MTRHLQNVLDAMYRRQPTPCSICQPMLGSARIYVITIRVPVGIQN